MSDQVPVPADHGEVRTEVLADMGTELGDTNAATVGTLRGMAEVVALGLSRLYDTVVRPVLRQLTWASAEGIWLEMHAMNAGLRKAPATAAAGRLVVTAEAGGTITEGTEVRVVGADVRYRVTADTPYQAGVLAALPVVATVNGAQGNVPPGTPLAVDDAGVSVTVPAGWPATSGRDAESEDGLQERIADRWGSLGYGHPVDLYRLVAIRSPGIVEADVIRLPRGHGSADVVCRSASGAPSAEELDAVRTALDGYEMLGRDIFVRAPSLVPAQVRIVYEPASATDAGVRIAAALAIAALPIGRALSEGAMYDALRARGIEPVSVDVGESDLVPVGPAGIVDPTFEVSAA